jgi:transposase
VPEACSRYQVSRKTGYKWLERYEKADPAGPRDDRSHRPYSCPHATPAAVIQQILTLQRRYRWGARKVRWLLAPRVPTVATVHRILEVERSALERAAGIIYGTNELQSNCAAARYS